MLVRISKERYFAVSLKMAQSVGIILGVKITSSQHLAAHDVLRQFDYMFKRKGRKLESIINIASPTYYQIKRIIYTIKEVSSPIPKMSTDRASFSLTS